jgi:hypothetical protein
MLTGLQETIFHTQIFYALSYKFNRCLCGDHTYSLTLREKGKFTMVENRLLGKYVYMIERKMKR